MSYGFFRTDWALEVRRIGNELAQESRQTLYLFRSGCGYAFNNKKSRCCKFEKAGKGYLQSAKRPTSTKPGLILMKSTPSFLYCTLNLATMMFMAALEAAYKAPISTSHSLVKSRSAIPVEMVMTFLTLPFRTRGRKRWKRWMLPTTLVCDSCDETASISSTLSLLLNASH